MINLLPNTLQYLKKILVRIRLLISQIRFSCLENSVFNHTDYFPIYTTNIFKLLKMLEE